MLACTPVAPVLVPVAWGEPVRLWLGSNRRSGTFGLPGETTPFTAMMPLSWSPWALTMKPFLSSWNWPLRLYWVPPCPSSTWKKPPPLMAMSSGLLVTEMLPWVNCWTMVDTREPSPIGAAPAPFSEAAKTSANCVEPAL
jgi:hypothetical protein